MYIVKEHIESIQINQKLEEFSLVVLPSTVRKQFLTKDITYPPRVISMSMLRLTGKYSSSYTPIDELEKELYVENNKVYSKPHIIFTLSSGQKQTKYFESMHELIKFKNLYLDGINVIKIK
jgi:hypothetical protein